MVARGDFAGQNAIDSYADRNNSLGIGDIHHPTANFVLEQTIDVGSNIVDASRGQRIPSAGDAIHVARITQRAVLLCRN